MSSECRRSQQVFQVMDNRLIAANTYRLELLGNITGLVSPGQFVELEVPGFYLKRPLSVCEVIPGPEGDEEGTLVLIYKVLGEGTKRLAEVTPGVKLTAVSGLGNGFWVPEEATQPLVVGGGVGVVPLRALVVELLNQGRKPQVIYGFNQVDEVFLAQETAGLGVDVTVTTVDGSAGTKGFVTDALAQLAAPIDYVYACGPNLMLDALIAAIDIPGQFSTEQRMACGFGACMGCVVETTTGFQRVCKEGPVFTRAELDLRAAKKNQNVQKVQG